MLMYLYFLDQNLELSFVLLICCILFPILFSSLLCFTHVVDIWAVGCIMAEMVRHKILFPGRDCILELFAAVSGSCYETERGAQAWKRFLHQLASHPPVSCYLSDTSSRRHTPAFFLQVHKTPTTRSPKQPNCCCDHHPKAEAH